VTIAARRSNRNWPGSGPFGRLRIGELWGQGMGREQIVERNIYSSQILKCRVFDIDLLWVHTQSKRNLIKLIVYGRLSEISSQKALSRWTVRAGEALPPSA
jgi:hypothetical protein